MQGLCVKFSTKADAVIYHVDGDVIMKMGKKTPRTTLKGVILIERNGEFRVWPQTRYDTGRFPIFVG